MYVGIAAGGALGAVLRHALVVLSGATPGRGFHSGHFLANVSGSLAIGLLAAVLTARGVGPEWRSFLITGILGSFTTYSAFSLDAVLLMENGDWRQAALYVIATVACCLAGCWAGLVVGRALL